MLCAASSSASGWCARVRQHHHHTSRVMKNGSCRGGRHPSSASSRVFTSPVIVARAKNGSSDDSPASNNNTKRRTMRNGKKNGGGGGGGGGDGVKRPPSPLSLASAAAGSSGVVEPFLTSAPAGVNLPETEDDAQLANRLNAAGFDPTEKIAPNGEACLVPVPGTSHRPIIYQTRPLPSVLILHTGGTLGMSTEAFEEPEDLQGATVFKSGTGGDYTKALQPGKLLLDLVTVVPELRTFANLEVKVLMNKDSCQIGPKDWIRIAKELHHQRENFDAFVVVHGTDTLCYTASAVSLMLAGFRKPIIITGSQLPLSMPRSDARQNLIDSITCATAGFSPPHVQLEEVAVCFGGSLLRANRTRKTSATIYSAFGSPQYPALAKLGVGIEWKQDALLQNGNGGGSSLSTYTPRLKLDPNVLRIPIVPGCDPKKAYGDLYARGVRGIVLEAFGVGNMPWTRQTGWIPWLRSQRKQGMQIYLTSQCESGELHPELYKTGSLALELGAESGPMMTPECAVVKLMLCLAHPNLPLSQPLAGEL